MSAGVALVVKGELWDTGVELHLIHTETYDQGIIQIRGKEINLTGRLHQILGTEHTTTESDWKLTPEFEIDFLKPKAAHGFSIGTQMGPFRFDYVNGSLDKTKSGQAFFVKMAVEDVLSAIPGFQKDWISGEIELGVVKGQAFQRQVKDGKTTFITVNEGLVLTTRLQIAGKTIDLLPEPSKDQPKEGETVTGTPAHGPKQLEVNKSMGPVYLRSVGFKLDKETLQILLSADFTLGPVSLSFLGLSTTVDLFKIAKDPLSAFTFKLYGLGLSFQKGPLQIAGFFQKDPEKEAYSGGVLIKTKTFAITGFGAYSNEGDYKSLFGFLCLNANIGGDPAFFITGISFCFGYNRQIIIPPIDKIGEFPLVRYAMDTGSAPKFNLKQSGANPLVTFNQNLAPYIPPKKGSFFFGVGVKFNTYKLMDTAALLVLSVGDDLEFSLIGLSRIALPPNGMGTPLVLIEIALRASYSVNKGVLQVEGQLTDRSYLFSPSVKLTGGFAFYAWFKDYETARAGDFVISVGGYHPLFKVPAHYPKVPRVGFEWRIGSALLVTGKMYMALTPCAVMAGAAFSAVWKSGGLLAAFSFVADFLMQWKPFKYDAHIAVNVQAGFTIDKWWITKTFSLDIGADLHIWGPDFSGTAELHARVCGIGVSFSIAFGAADNSTKRLSWNEFKTSFLPEKALGINNEGSTTIITAQTTAGLIKEMEGNREGEKIALVNPKEFTMTVDSLIPLTEYKEYGKDESVKQTEFCLPAVGRKGVKSEFEVTLNRNGVPVLLKDSRFRLTPNTKQMPRAVWNDKVETNPISPDQTLEMTTGLTFKAPNQLEEAAPLVRKAKAFAFNESENRMEQLIHEFRGIQYTDFMLMDETYNKKDFQQISAKDVEDYQNYYGDQTKKTNIDPNY